MSRVLIEANAVTKTFSRDRETIHLFSGLNFSVAEGQTVAITGPSGCGKSTLMFLLAGLDRPDSGEITWMGQPIGVLGETKRSRLRGATLGFVFQFHHLMPEFSALENVMMPALIQGDSFQTAADKARPLLERLGVWHRKDHRPSELSGGEQQRVSFARALVNRPPVILADEPTGNLDETNAGILLQLMHDVVRDIGLSFVIVTHDVQVAASCSHRYHLSHGSLVQVE